MTINNLVAAASQLAARLEEDIKSAASRQDHIRLTERAIEAKEIERLALLILNGSPA